MSSQKVLITMKLEFSSQRLAKLNFMLANCITSSLAESSFPGANDNTTASLEFVSGSCECEESL